MVWNGHLKDSVSYLNGLSDGLRKEWYVGGQLKHRSQNHIMLIVDEKTHWTSDEKCWDEEGKEIKCK